MGIESVNKGIYATYADRITPTLIAAMGLVVFFVSLPSVGPDAYGSFLVAVTGLYMVVESAHDFVNQLTDYQLHQSKGQATWVAKGLQVAMLCFVAFAAVTFVVILVDNTDDVQLVLELCVAIIIAGMRMFEIAMGLFWMDDAAKYVQLMFEIQRGHLMSVIRDAYRLFLSHSDASGVPAQEAAAALKSIEAMEELPAITLRQLGYARRIRSVSEILKGNVSGSAFNGTGAAIWREFNIEIADAAHIDENVPSALLQCLEEECPFSGDAALKVKDTHVWFFVPSQHTAGLSEPLSAARFGEHCKEFLPGIGVIWRYQPCDEDLEGDNAKDRWILMYKGVGADGDGILPGTLDTNWEESLAVLRACNGSGTAGTEGTGHVTCVRAPAILGPCVCSGSPARTQGYDVMSSLEVEVGAYTHFVRTGSRMYQEKFTRVKERVDNEQYGVHHLFMGRFNMSGLNNDAYLDVGGDGNRFHLRGLSVCKRYVLPDGPAIIDALQKSTEA